MRSVQTQQTVPLSCVKPLEGLRRYRAACLAATREALRGPTQRLALSPVSGAALVSAWDVEGLEYVRDPATGSLFFAERPEPRRWGELLAQISRYRHSPDAFHAGLTQSRTDHVYAPKLEWIEDALRLQGVSRPTILEVRTAPSDFTSLLQESRTFGGVMTADETQLVLERPVLSTPQAGAVVLLEALERISEPATFLHP